MLRAYYDGSGQPHDSEFVTLAGVIASETVWQDFDQRWDAVLEEYQAPSFHMTDAMHLRGEFSEKCGWDRQKVDKLVTRLWGVIGEFRSTDKFSLGTNLVGSSCTVIMKDYWRVKGDNPNLRSPYAICTNFCVNIVPPDLDSKTEHPEMALVFDGKEPFLHPIYRNWCRLVKSRKSGWPKQIKEISFGNSTNMRPLQAADLLAWTMNRHHRKPSFWGSLTFLLLEHYSITYDYATILSRFPNG